MEAGKRCEGFVVALLEGNFYGLNALDGLFEAFRRIDGRDPSLVDDGDPVAGDICLLDVVGGEKDGDSPAGQVLEYFPDNQVALDVKAGGWLVQEEEFWIVDQTHRKGETPFHPLRKAVHPAPLPLHEAEGGKKRRSPLFRSFFRTL